MNIDSIKFPEPVTLQHEVDMRWTVAKTFCADVAGEFGPSGHYVCLYVPEGFVTDLASVPRVAWSILPPEGKYDEAAVIHDYIYSLSGQLPGVTFSRSDVDRILMLGMQSCGVSWLTRNTMWAAVRAFGGSHWGVHHNQKGNQ